MFRKLLIASAALAMAGAAKAGPVTFVFGPPAGNLTNTHTYTDGGSGLSIVAKGFDGVGGTADLYGKNDGGDEIGLGLANDPTGDHEIHNGSGFVQLDVTDLLGKVDPLATFFSTGSTSDGEEWAVYGSNTSGSHGLVALLTGTNEASHLLPSLGTYDYYDFVEANHTDGTGDNFLIHGLTSREIEHGGVPEPATWAMMLMGFGGLGAALRRRRNGRAAITA